MNYSVIGEKIMAKKSLTDLLREEVEKSPDLNSATEHKTNDDEHIEQNVEAVEKSPMNTPAKANARRSAPTKSTPTKSTSTKSTPTKADLEATVAELKAALEEAQHKETALAELKDSLEESHRKEKALQQQISELQSDLHDQNKSLQKLQKELEKIADLKTEFEQAKKAASQLAKANEALTQEINALKKEKEGLKVHLPKAPDHRIERPIQKESGTPGDFAKNSWLL
jgi:chromosome segregation ATPase